MAVGTDSKRTSFLDTYFKITERGSTVSREVRGGIVTFFAMSYIVVLNPLILGSFSADDASAKIDVMGNILPINQVAAEYLRLQQRRTANQRKHRHGFDQGLDRVLEIHVRLLTLPRAIRSSQEVLRRAPGISSLSPRRFHLT